MNLDRAVQALSDACTCDTAHQPLQRLDWLARDVLADIGVANDDPPPESQLPWLRQTSVLYAEAVIAHPFTDLLGQVYQTLGSRGRRAQLGQFYTPDSVSKLIGAMLLTPGQHVEPSPDGRLWTACEPACGSGALILGFLDELLTQRGPAALQHWSISAIDLDSMVTRLCAAQVLANLMAQQLTLGELVVYHGDALRPASELRVVVHCSRADLKPDIVLPALHPARIGMLRQVQRSTLSPDAAPSGPPSKPPQAIAPGKQAAPLEPAQVNLFADSSGT